MRNPAQGGASVSLAGDTEDLTPKPLSRQAKWQKANPLKRWAHIALASGLKRGLVERKPCEVCGAEQTDAHHPDYDRPLAVVWRFAGHAVAHLLQVGRIDLYHAKEVARDGDPLFQHALGLLGVAERPKKLQSRPRRETNFFRDVSITMLVQELIERFPPIKPTSSSKSGHAGCACGIVADAMGMSYDAVCQVWKRLGKQI